jgi:hypothetical protein
MKKGCIITLVLSFLYVLIFCDIAISGGFEPCPGCCPDTLPSPDHGPYLYGTFTAARDKSQCSVDFPAECAHYNAHVVLRHRLNQVHLFSFPVSLQSPGNLLCGYEASDIKELLAKVPCTWGFNEPFGLLGVPVISDLYITKRDFCGTPDEMIHGLITIRVVP